MDGFVYSILELYVCSSDCRGHMCHDGGHGDVTVKNIHVNGAEVIISSTNEPCTPFDI